MSSPSAVHTGGCLCGAVRYEAQGALRPIVMCHCSQCRRTSGHFLAATAARHADFRLVSQGELHWYASSAEGRRGFCARCGSTLFWQGTGRDYVSIAAGTLDDTRGLEVAWHIFVDDKGAYYEIDDRAPQSSDGTFHVPW
ncbi:MAG TPA: GFA family protein [Steroidobacteraceae bacterium]|nr:GFA family protein [Steroidobacteraceae bacterium]